MSHTALREPPAQPRTTTSRLDAQPLPIQLELDVRSRAQPCPLTQVLRYHDLPLGANTVNHTDTV